MSAIFYGSSSSVNLDRHLQCPGCQKTRYHLKCLPCHHTFCPICIDEEVQKNGQSGPLLCRVCKEEFRVQPEEPGYGFKDDIFVKERCQLLAKLGVIESKANGVITKAHCDGCKNVRSKNISMAEKFCIECNKYFCQPCRKQHDLYRKHSIIDFPYKGGAELPMKGVKNSCEKHQDQILDIFCSDCNMVVCGKCCIPTTGHSCRDHSTKDVDDAAKEIQEQINNLLTKLQSLHGESGSLVQNLEVLNKNLDEETRNRKIQITKRCDAIINQVEVIKKELLDSVESFKYEKASDIKSQMEAVKFQDELLEDLIGYLKFTSQSGSNSSIAVSGRDLLARCNNQIIKSEEVFVKQVQIPQLNFREDSFKLEKALVGDLRQEE